MTRVRDNGTVYARGTRFGVTRALVGALVYVVDEDDKLLVLDTQGTLIIEHRWPKPGTQYVGSGRRRGPRGPRKTTGLSEMS